MHVGERLNSITHLVGAVLSVAGLATLVTMGALDGDAYKVVSFSVYGAMLFVLYAISTLYHSVSHPRLKAILQKCDHSAIYLLIAGSYTPFTLVTLRGPWGWSLFGVVWGLAMAGIVFKFWFVERFGFLSTTVYLLMGWLVVIAARPALSHVPASGLIWLAAGGLYYTAGVIFYASKRIPYAHVIWHVFILAGSTCHYFAVLRCLLPAVS